MDRLESGDRLYFDDDPVFDEQIEAVAKAKFLTAIDDRQRDLAGDMESAIEDLEREACDVR
jgi:hypothetical protein